MFEKKSSWDLTLDQEHNLMHYPDQDHAEFIELVYTLEEKYEVEFKREERFSLLLRGC